MKHVKAIKSRAAAAFRDPIPHLFWSSPGIRHVRSARNEGITRRWFHALALGFVITGFLASLSGCESQTYNKSRADVELQPPAIRQTPPAGPSPVSDPNAVVTLPVPLVPIGPATQEDTASLIRSLAQLKADPSKRSYSLLEKWTTENPQSAWRAGILTNLGRLYFESGRFSKAIASFEQAWKAGRDADEARGQALADQALGELMRMHARLGHTERLEELFAEVDGGGRYPSGAAQLINSSKEALWFMKNEPGVSFMCGPYALKNVALQVDQTGKAFQALKDVKSGPRGTSLQQLDALARRAGLDFVAAFQVGDARLPIPSVVHWKVNHFAAVVEYNEGRYRINDPTFGPNLWVDENDLRAEASGYFLVRQSAMTSDDWRRVTPDEGRLVFGMGLTQENDPKDFTDEDHKSCCDAPQPSSPTTKGLASYAVHSMLVSVNIQDTPLGYVPPKGPPMNFRLTYNQRDNRPANTYNFTNWGPGWTFNWISYIQDNPTNPNADVMQYVRGGGWHDFPALQPSTNAYARSSRSHGRLVRVTQNPIVYKLELPDGSVDTFAQSDGGITTSRRVFLTEHKDPSGNVVTLSYVNTGGAVRLTEIRDAVNAQPTTLTYGSDNLVTRITDPFGNFAQFAYTNGRLSSITDPANISSQFGYDPTNANLVKTLTTPYGTTTFYVCDSTFDNDPTKDCSGLSRVVTVMDPEQKYERVLYSQTLGATTIPNPATGGDAPPPPLVNDVFNNGPPSAAITYRNTFVWNKKAMWDEVAGAPILDPAVSSAWLLHWLHSNDLCAPPFTDCLAPQYPNVTDGILESEKPPLQNRIWYVYANSRTSPSAAYPASAASDALYSGTSEQPIKIGQRINASGTEYKLTTLRYNEFGKVVQRIEHIGGSAPIETVYEYADNGIDLLKVKRPIAGTDTITDNFAGALDPAWSVTKFDPAGTVTSGAGSLVVSTVGDFSNTCSGSGCTGPYFDTGVMVCRRIPGVPATIEVTQTLTTTGTPTTAGLGVAPRVLMLRSSLDASSTDIQLFYRTDGTREVRLGGRFDGGEFMTTVGTGKFLPASPAALVPVRGRFEFDGTTATPSVSINNGAFQSLTAAKMPDLRWACLASNGLSATTPTPPPIESYASFTMVTPAYETLASYTYNSAHQPLTYTDALGKTTTFTYTAGGQIQTVTDPLAHTRTWVYGGAGVPGPDYLASVKNANNEVVESYGYDAKKRLSSITEPATGRTVTLSYDALDRVTTVTHQADGTTEVFAYDKLDVASYTDRLQRITRYAYNALGQLNSIRDAAAPAPNTLLTPCIGCKGYADLTDPVSQKTTVLRDVALREYDESSSDRGRVTRQFDAAGRMSTLTDVVPGGTNIVATYTYDAIDRVKAVTYPAPNNTENLSFVYDTAAGCTNGIGRLCSVTDGAGTTVFNYDKNGRVVSETRTEAGITPAFVTSYVYDDAGQLTSLSLPTGKSVTITPDAVGRTQTLSTMVNGSSTPAALSAVSYNANDQLTSQTFGNGLVEDRQYNADGRLWKVNLTAPGDTDADGMPDAWEDAYPGALSSADPSDAELDSDGDGLTNVQEFNLSTNPTKFDTDGDGMLDGTDEEPGVQNWGWMIPILRQVNP